jgi:hypothetical protein
MKVSEPKGSRKAPYTMRGFPQPSPSAKNRLTKKVLMSTSNKLTGERSGREVVYRWD